MSFTSWGFQYGIPDGPIYPVRAILSRNGDERLLVLLLGAAGQDEALTAFAEQSVRLLMATFSDTRYWIVAAGDADEAGLPGLGGAFARQVARAEWIPSERSLRWEVVDLRSGR